MKTNQLNTSLLKASRFYLTAVIALTVLLSACKKESTSDIPASINEKVDLAVAKPESAQSTFTGGLVTGTARVYQTNSKYQLALENFTSSPGPDLYVYLSKEQQPVNFVNLGALKANSGNQLYDIPTTVNFKDYTYVLIYCRSYNHLYGYSLFTF